MEVGVEVWIRDTHGNQSWIPAFIQNKVGRNDNYYLQKSNLKFVQQETLPDGKQSLVARDENGTDFRFW